MSSTVDTHEDELRSLVTGSSLGAVGSIVLGKAADLLGAAGFYPIEGVVRWIGGNSDTLGELIWVLRRKKQGKNYKKALRYVKGELLGTLAGPVTLILFYTLGVHFGINPYGPIGVLIAGAFAHADNIGGMIADLRGRMHEFGFKEGIKHFSRSYYQQGNLIFISLSVIISLWFRLHGFEPRENFFAGIEGALMGSMDSVGAGLYAQLMHRYFPHVDQQK